MLNLFMNFGARLIKIMEMKNMTSADLSKKIGKAESQISQWRIGVRVPAQENLFLLAKALDISPELLDPKNPINQESNVEKAEVPHGKVPLISWTHAGEWASSTDPYPVGMAEDWVSWDTKHKGVYALKVRGNSMEPEYRDGDIIFVDPTKQPIINDDIVAEFDGETQLKRLKVYKPQEMVLLSPLNQIGHKDVILTGKELKKFRTLGVVEGSLRKKKRR